MKSAFGCAGAQQDDYAQNRKLDTEEGPLGGNYHTDGRKHPNGRCSSHADHDAIAPQDNARSKKANPRNDLPDYACGVSGLRGESKSCGHKGIGAQTDEDVRAHPNGLAVLSALKPYNAPSEHAGRNGLPRQWRDGKWPSQQHLYPIHAHFPDSLELTWESAYWKRCKECH